MNKSEKRHEVFARNWVIDFNGTRSALAAGYSQDSAHSQSTRLLKNAKVRRLINKYTSERASRLEIKADRVLEEIARLAFSNMGDYTRVDEDGKAVIDLTALDKDKFAAIQEIREDTAGGAGDGERKLILRTTLKLADKTKNLELLARHLKLLTDKVEHTATEGLIDILNDARKRADNAA